MKILIASLDDSKNINVGGKHIHQNLLKRALEELGHSVHFVFPKRSIYYLLVRLGLKLLKYFNLITDPHIFKWTLAFMKKSLSSQIRDIDSVDCIFAQDPVSACATDIVKNNSSAPKVCMTLHGYLARESVNYGNYHKEDYDRILSTALEYERDSLSYSDIIISVDTKIADYLRGEFSATVPITILKNAIDPDFFKEVSLKNVEGLKQKLEINNQDKVILVPRRLVRKNGVDIAIKALSNLNISSNLNYKLLIMGDGPELNKLKSLAKDLEIAKDIIFTGSIDHRSAAAYYKLADIVLIPSVIRDGVEEATSLSMLEGMAARKIVIVSNIGGMKEVITHNVNGFLFTQGDYIELSELLRSIENLPSENAKRICDDAFDFVVKNHHYKSHAIAYLESVSQVRNVN